MALKTVNSIFLAHILHNHFFYFAFQGSLSKLRWSMVHLTNLLHLFSKSIVNVISGYLTTGIMIFTDQKSVALWRYKSNISFVSIIIAQ